MVSDDHRPVRLELPAAARRLLEVTLQHALQSNAVAGLVASHLVDGVVDGIQTVLLGAGGQIKLALSCAELAVNTPCQIVLGSSLIVVCKLVQRGYRDIQPAKR